jgi:hypothetical protein
VARPKIWRRSGHVFMPDRMIVIGAINAAQEFPETI